MKTWSRVCRFALITAALALPALLVGQATKQGGSTKHHHYKLIELETLGGPQSYGDGGHGAANINNRGVAAGVAEIATPDSNYPNFNPLMSNFGPDPYVFHAFVSNGGPLVDLGSFPGANNSAAGHITDSGLVSGMALNGEIDPLTGWPEENAVLWKDGLMINLGTLGGYESGTYAVNSKGQVVGFSGNTVPDDNSLLGLGTQTRSFFWENGVMQDMGTLGGNDAFAPLINESGQAAGFSSKADGSVDPFLWKSGQMIDLGSFGGTFGAPNAINNHGQVIGGSNLAGDNASHAFLWDNGKLIDIGSLGGSYGEAWALNELGFVAGQATTTGDAAFHGFFWRKGVLTDVGVLPGFDGSCVGAFGINAKGQVVGQAVENFCAGPAARAFLWENGDIIDLNIFVPPDSDLTLADVEEINESGEMFGLGVLPDGNERAFLLIPCDENHPNVEGCNYTMMSAVRSPAVRPPVHARSSLTRRPAAWRNLLQLHVAGSRN